MKFLLPLRWREFEALPSPTLIICGPAGLSMTRIKPTGDIIVLTPRVDNPALVAYQMVIDIPPPLPWLKSPVCEVQKRRINFGKTVSYYEDRHLDFPDISTSLQLPKDAHVGIDGVPISVFITKTFKIIRRTNERKFEKNESRESEGDRPEKKIAV